MPHVTWGAKNSEMCHNLPAAAAHRPRMGPTQQLVGRQSLSERKASLATPNSPTVSGKLWNNPQSLVSFSRRQIHLCLRHEAATNSARANEGLLLSLCCVLKKKARKNVAEIFFEWQRVTVRGFTEWIIFLHWQSDREEWQVREWLGSWVSQDQGPYSNSCR